MLRSAARDLRSLQVYSLILCKVWKGLAADNDRSVIFLSSYRREFMLVILLTALAINTGLSVLLGVWARGTSLGFRKVFLVSAISGALTGLIMVRNARRRCS